MDKKTRHIISKGPKRGLREEEIPLRTALFFYSAFINNGNKRIIMIHTLLNS